MEAGWILPRAAQGLCEYWQEVQVVKFKQGTTGVILVRLELPFTISSQCQATFLSGNVSLILYQNRLL